MYKGKLGVEKGGAVVRRDDVDRSCRQTSIDGGTNKQLYRMKMDQTSTASSTSEPESEFYGRYPAAFGRPSIRSVMNSSKHNHICGMAACLGLQRPSGLVNKTGLYFGLF